MKEEFKQNFNAQFSKTKNYTFGIIPDNLSLEWQEQSILFIQNNLDNFITVNMYQEGYNLIEIYTNRLPVYENEIEIKGSELFQLRNKSQLVLMDIAEYH